MFRDLVSRCARTKERDLRASGPIEASRHKSCSRRSWTLKGSHQQLQGHGFRKDTSGLPAFLSSAEFKAAFQGVGRLLKTTRKKATKHNQTMCWCLTKPSVLLTILNFLQERGKDFPGPEKLIISNKAFLLSSDPWEDQPSVGQRTVDFFIAMVVRQIHFSGGHSCGQTWLFHVKLEIDCLTGRDPHHQLVSGTFLFEEPRIGVILLELNPHFTLALLQSWMSSRAAFSHGQNTFATKWWL